jgi:Rrf2 family protein
MPRLNQKTRYALDCLFELSRTPDEFVDAQHVAMARKVPPAYAQKILQALSQAGIVHAQKGAGYQLARPLAAISALEVVRAVELADVRGSHVDEHPLERRIHTALATVTLKTLFEQA